MVVKYKQIPQVDFLSIIFLLALMLLLTFCSLFFAYMKYLAVNIKGNEVSITVETINK